MMGKNEKRSTIIFLEHCTVTFLVEDIFSRKENRKGEREREERETIDTVWNTLYIV